jgi:hypothetical protein
MSCGLMWVTELNHKEKPSRSAYAARLVCSQRMRIRSIMGMHDVHSDGYSVAQQCSAAWLTTHKRIWQGM